MHGADQHLKVLVADDHALVRQALCRLLSHQRLSVCGKDLTPSFVEADGFDAALEALAAQTTDLLLIDLSMPGMATASSLRALREAHPTTKIVVITAWEDRVTMLDCLAAGVHGYVTKTSEPEAIRHAVEDVLSGQIYVPPAIANVGVETKRVENPISAMPKDSVAPGSIDTTRITRRQLDVLRHLAQGRSTKEIARALGLGVGTIKVHLAAIYRLLNARSRTEAVVLASKLKL